MNNIKLERIRRSLTQPEIAAVLEVSDVTYRRKEKQGGFTDKELRKLADFYSCSVDYLLGRGNDEKQ